MQAHRHSAKTPQRADGSPDGRKSRRVFYPYSDGKPMAETQVHLAELIRSLLTLEDHFAADAQVYIGADMFLYYEEGNPRACVAPDLFVAKGVVKARRRNSYFLWEEGSVPSFVLELTSRSTSAEDRRKQDVYGGLGVPEYVLFDPLPREGRRRAATSEALQGYRLGAGGYVPIPKDAEGGLISNELGLRLVVVEAGRLGWYDVGTGRRLLDPRERAAIEAKARRQAEARVAELEALLRRLQPPAPEA